MDEARLQVNSLGEVDDSPRSDLSLLPCEHGAAYDVYIESMRRTQYPMLKDTLYLDHAGMVLPSKKLLDSFHQDLLLNLYGNPHSATSSIASTQIETARSDLLRFFNADPAVYDLVFTANATAAIKLIGDALREIEGGFRYGYHVDSHTSLVGMRELAQEARCLASETELQAWIGEKRPQDTTLLAFPAQSNMSGKRLPLEWCTRYTQNGVYVLLDAAAYASTTPLDLNAISADFTVVSLYKIFGFPDLGALIVKKSTAHLFQHRRYFGGGTVDAVVCMQEPWHARRAGALHEQLEDGTLPVHSIVALNSALVTFADLFGTLKRVSNHTLFLARQLHRELVNMRYPNGRQVCKVYSAAADPEDHTTQGSIVAFNVLDQDGRYISTGEIEKLAAIKDIRLRTGSVCNPGGVAAALHLSSEDLRKNFAAGYRCGGGTELIDGIPTGVVRVSLGAISTMGDVNRFVGFIHEYFEVLAGRTARLPDSPVKQLHVESLTIYPVKSCAGWSVPYDRAWQVNREGLAYDREWCIVRTDNGVVLSQKQFPKMALLRPEIDTAAGELHINLTGSTHKLNVLLSTHLSHPDRSMFSSCSAGVCGDVVPAQRYTSRTIAESLSTYLGVACTLARFPAAASELQSQRHSKEHLKSTSLPLLLSNESPILTITRSSLDAVNETLKARGKRAAHHSVFRANIILAELPSQPPSVAQAWEEDYWQDLQFQNSTGLAGPTLSALGGCRRCQMVCVDQQTGEKRSEVFLTLAKQRRINGKILFGIHCAMTNAGSHSIQVGDRVDIECRS